MALNTRLAVNYAKKVGK